MKKNTLKLLISVVFLNLASQTALATTWFVPSLDADQELWAVNTDKQELVVVQSPPHRDGNIENEESFAIPARSTVRLPYRKSAEAFWQIRVSESHSSRVSESNPERSHLAHDNRAAPAPGLRLWLKQKSGMTEIPAGRSSLRSSLPASGIRNSFSETEALVVTNLTPLPQTARVVVYLAQGKVETVQPLKGFEQIKIPLPLAASTKIEVEGENNLLAHLIGTNGIQIFHPQAENSRYSSRVRFLMGQPGSDESFVVEMEDPKLIEQARAQIASPNDFRARILIAEISEGSGFVNQNLAHPLRGSWSWHVSRVVKFAEFASQNCDGSPEFVESYLNSWLASKSPICFWNYRIRQELTP